MEKNSLLKVKVISKVQHLAHHSTLCPKQISDSIQTNLNHFVFSTKNPPIPTEYAGLSIDQGGYEYISFQKRFNAIAIISSFSEYVEESLPPPVQRLMTCSLISLLPLKFDLIQLTPLLNNPTFLLDAVLLIKDVIKEKMDDNKKLKTANPNILAIWHNGIMLTLPTFKAALRGVLTQRRR